MIRFIGLSVCLSVRTSKNSKSENGFKVSKPKLIVLMFRTRKCIFPQPRAQNGPSRTRFCPVGPIQSWLEL